jgi:type IV pilus assembly protein PilM
MEVGTSTVRLAEVQKRGNKVEVMKTHVFDTPDDATKDGKVRVSDTIVSAIRDGIDESGITATDVYFVVESTKILYKQVELPFVRKGQIQGALELAFGDIFPVDPALYHISYVYEKSYEKNGQKMMALDVFAIPNDLSESYYNLSVALNLNAKGLTDTSRSMISLFPNSFRNRNVAMVNINENVSTLTVTVDGDMIFNKTIPYGIADSIRLVMNSSLTKDDIDVTSAIKLLYTQNILMPQLPAYLDEDASEEIKLQYGVTTSVISLTKSIEQTLVAFLSKENIQIQEFHLSGLGAGVSKISQLMAHEFGIPVTVIQQEGNLLVSAAAAADGDMLIGCYPCVGASIDRANFFTKEEQAGGEIARNKKIDTICLIIGGVALVGGLVAGVWKLWDVNTAKKKAESENTRIKGDVQELRDLGVEDAYNDYITAVSYNEQVNSLYDETRSGNEDMTTFLGELESLLPMTARIVTMTLDPSSAMVSFMCEDKFIAAGVLHLLRNMDTITDMECTGVAEVDATGEIAFVCQFTLKSTEQRRAEEEAENQVQDSDGGVENPDDEATDPTGPDDGEDKDEKLLAETTAVNTDILLQTITIGETKLELINLSTEALDRAGFEFTGSYVTAANDALNFVGVGYANADEIEIGVAEINGSVAMIQIENENISLYNGIRVGMSVDEALTTLGVDALYENGYLILNNGRTTMVICADFDGEIIETIYLIDNSLAFELENREEITPDDANNEEDEGGNEE